MRYIILKKLLLTSTLLISSINATEYLHTDDHLKKEVYEEKFNFYGDIRIRDQEVHRDDKDNSYKQRYRIRAGLSFKATENIILEAQISSGKGNPTSGNVDFSKGFKDQFKIDILDVEYKMENFWIRVGKSKHHFDRPLKSQLIWDNDIRPEGISYKYKKDGKNFYTGAFRMRDYTKTSDKDIYYFVGEYTQKINDFKLGGGFYHYQGVKGNTAKYNKGALGNSYNGVYLNDYSLLSIQATYTFYLLERPLSFAVSGVYNFQASNDNFGYDLSIGYGKIKKDFDWQIGYTYRDIQKDATFGAHNDSDFANGGTDNNGHMITGKLRLQKNLFLAINYQYTDRKVSEGGLHYDRLMSDLIFKF